MRFDYWHPGATIRPFLMLNPPPDSSFSYIFCRTIPFITCTEPEPVAPLSLQSWSATSSKAIAVICICLLSLSHFLAHWTITEPIWSAAKRRRMFSLFLSVIQCGAIHQAALFLTSAGFIRGSFFTLFHTSEHRGGQIRIICSTAGLIHSTWLCRHSDQNNNHTSVWLENSQSYCFPRLLLLGCLLITHRHATRSSLSFHQW